MTTAAWRASKPEGLAGQVTAADDGRNKSARLRTDEPSDRISRLLFGLAVTSSSM
jgi:hypothetical protein